jgi:hypothetical protein
MNYPQEKYREVRSATGLDLSISTIDRILSIFATVPQLTREQWKEAWKIYRCENDLRGAINTFLAKQGPVVAAKPADGMVLLEDALTIANQRALLDKYDADNTALMQENAKLKARTLSCVFCGDPMETMEALKTHSADCPKHPAVIENAKLKAQVERLSDPVTSVEEISSLATFDNALRNHCGRKQSENAMEQALGWLIASRSAGKEERTTYPHEGHCSCSSYLPVGSPGCCCNRKRMEEHHA